MYALLTIFKIFKEQSFIVLYFRNSPCTIYYKINQNIYRYGEAKFHTQEEYICH